MRFIEAKTILSGYCETNRWFGSNYNMNIYKGCNHGCIYCDSRSDCYHVDNFDEVRGKLNSLEILERDLISKRKKGVIGTGSMSDPYNPFEAEYKLTRGALELINKYKFGLSIVTKSSLITRDIDILQKIQNHSPILVKLTITTADDKLCRKIETNVCPSSERFDAIKRLTDNGIFARVLLMPILPFINDSEENIKEIVRLSHKSGAKFIYGAFGVTLRSNQRLWFYKKIDSLFPGIKEKYIKTFGQDYECPSPKAKTLWEIFTRECEKYGIIYKMEDIIMTYRKNYAHDFSEQLKLF